MIVKKRFWKETAVIERDGAFAIALDGRTVKTPAKADLILPTVELAELIASEWDAVDGEINPTIMPATKLANSAIDTVAANKSAVADMLAAYAGTDLLCYWADHPEGLVENQRAHWQPTLEWASGHFGLPLATTNGLMPIAQDPRVIPSMHSALMGLSEFELAGMHDVIALSGSAFLAWAWYLDEIQADQVWEASRVDAEWQIAQWGEDEDEAVLVEKKRQEFHFAARFCKMSCQPG